MAVDDDVLHKNPFGFELAGVVVNDSVTREALTRDQMRKFLKFVHDDNVYCKYYEVVYILFHTGMRLSLIHISVFIAQSKFFVHKFHDKLQLFLSSLLLADFGNL